MRLLPYVAVLITVALLGAAGASEKPSEPNADHPKAEQGLYGNWRVNSLTLVGEGGERETFPNADVEGPLSAIISEKTITLWVSNQKFAEISYRLDATQTPGAIDAKYQGRELLGVCRRKGDKLTILLNEAASGRPKGFDSRESSVAMDLTHVDGRKWAVMNADGTNLHRLPGLLEYTGCGSPLWSNDGTRVAFDACRVILGEPWTQCHIFITDADGKNPKDLGIGAMPSWSPDDKRIAYSKYSPRGIWVMNADGSEDQPIDSEGWGVRWSPKKEELAYTVSNTSSQNISVHDLKTQEKRLLLLKPYRRIYWGFSWSPDGRRLCFKGMLPDRTTEIAMVRAEGQDKGFRVLFPREDVTGISNPVNYTTWSSDGKQVLVSMIGEGNENYQIYVLDVEGKLPPKRLKGQDPSCNNHVGTWSSDGKKILFTAAPGTPVEETEEE